MIEKRSNFTKPTPQYRRGFSDHDILYYASKGKGGRGISAEKMKSMADWLDYNLEIDELHDEIKRVGNKMIKDLYIPEGFDKELAKRDKEIAELKKQLQDKEQTVDETITELNNEVKDNLQQAEAFREMQKNMQELLEESAEITVDKYIKECRIPRHQKETAKKLYLSNREMFDEMYKDAPVIVDTSQKPQSKKQYDNVQQIADYFKN